IRTNSFVSEVIIEGGRAVKLANFRTQITHVNSPGVLHGVIGICRVLEQAIWVSRLKLQLRQRAEELTSTNLTLRNSRILHPLIIIFGNTQIRERLTF